MKTFEFIAKTLVLFLFFILFFRLAKTQVETKNG